MASFSKVSHIVGVSWAWLENRAPLDNDPLPYRKRRVASKLAEAEIASDARGEAFKAALNAREGDRLRSCAKEPVELVLRKVCFSEHLQLRRGAKLVKVFWELVELGHVNGPFNARSSCRVAQSGILQADNEFLRILRSSFQN